MSEKGTNLEPVHELPALLLRSGGGDNNGKKGDMKDYIIIADLHLGLEQDLRRKGFRVPSMHARLLSHLRELRNYAANLVILGDFKHSISVDSEREMSDMVSFLKELGRLFHRIILIKGNHDGNLHDIVKRAGGERDNMEVVGGQGLALYGVGLFHGHAWPSPEVMACGTVVMGHNHPVISFSDSLGHVTRRDVWLRIPLTSHENCPLRKRYPDTPQELIVMPSFNPFLGGLDVRHEELMGPVLRTLSGDVIQSGGVYLLDGTYLGTLGELSGIKD